MRLLFIVLIALCALSAGPHATAAQTSPLHWVQIVQEILSHNQEVLTREQRLLSAQAAVQAVGPPNPVLTVSAFAGNTVEEANNITQPLELRGQVGLRRQEAQGQVMAAQAELEATRLDITRDAGLAFFRLVVAEKRIRSAEESESLVDQLLKIANRRYALGDAPQTHVLRSEVEVARAQLEVQAARGEREVARIELNHLMGHAPDDALPLASVGPNLSGPLPTMAVLRATALDHRPEVLAARAELVQAQGRLGLVRAERGPDGVLVAHRSTFIPSDANPLSQGVRLGLSFPLWDRGTLRGQERSAEQVVRTAALALEASQASIVGEVVAARAQLETARTRLARLGPEVVDRLQVLSDKTTAGYQGGVLTFLDVLEARRALLEARRESLEAFSAYGAAWVQLSHSVGLPLANDAIVEKETP